ncbi:sur7 protein [Diplodia corticola]|uniref:Sur7 protein n=1 Tax=Diplodia corticola TaxID=236234 RepID=A0A1J9QXS8_9PEZI|nr:sur7 protein [Diplodia corticola]OJD33838.1 sur7 protein [Diplodia corticola]
MRPSALFPALCAMAAVILGFLCIFAGHKKDFMEDYHILTLNTSRIGQNILSELSDSSSSSSSGLLGLIENATSSISSELTDSLNNAVNSVAESIAEDIGLSDFYSAHLMDYCWGDYTPQAVANASVSASQIHKNVSACSNSTAMFHFDPTAVLEKSLNESGLGITLDDLNWPDDIQQGLDALRIAYKAMFVLYCIAVGTSFLVLFGSVAGVFLASGRLSAFFNVMIAILAFLAFGIASAIATAIAVKGSDVINQYGNDIGIEAHRGGKFMAISWAGTGVLFLAILAWCVECCIGRRHKKRTTFAEKP